MAPVPAPPLPDSIEAGALDAAARQDLRGLAKDVAEVVARHLVAAGVLVDEDPEQALAHARYARQRASRIAVVREAAGIAAYHAGEWAEALADLRAARRMGGSPGHLAVMADIERALGRPERAIELGRSSEVSDLDRAAQVELAMVIAGARRDLGELDAAVVGLQIPELDAARHDPWSARLFYAYADNLLAAGRESDAVEWFVHAVDADAFSETDAGHRLADLTGEPPPEDDDIAFDIEDAPIGPDADDEREAAADAVVEDAGSVVDEVGVAPKAAVTDADAVAEHPGALSGEVAVAPQTVVADADADTGAVAGEVAVAPEAVVADADADTGAVAGEVAVAPEAVVSDGDTGPDGTGADAREVPVAVGPDPVAEGHAVAQDSEAVDGVAVAEGAGEHPDAVADQAVGEDDVVVEGAVGEHRDAVVTAEHPEAVAAEAAAADVPVPEAVDAPVARTEAETVSRRPAEHTAAGVVDNAEDPARVDPDGGGFPSPDAEAAHDPIPTGGAGGA